MHLQQLLGLLSTHLAVLGEKSEASAARLLDGPPDRDGVTILFVLKPVLVVEQGHLQDSVPLPPVPGTYQRKNGDRQSSIMPKTIVKRGRYKYFGVDTMGKYGWLPRYYGGTVPLYPVESCANDRVGHSAFTFRLLYTLQ